MLIKSVKHDLMATYRDFVGIYVALLVAAILGPFVLQTGQGVFTVIAIIVAFGLTIATVLITFLTIIRLYNRRLFSNEGYLTMTLPVKTHITIMSKVITGLIWSTATSIMMILAAALFYGIYMILSNVFDFQNLNGFITFLNELINSLMRWDVLSVLLIQAPLTLASSIKDLVLLVFIMTFVNTSFIKKGKLAIGVAAYMIIGSLFNTIVSVFTLLVVGVSETVTQGSILINGMPLGAPISFAAYTIQMGFTVMFILVLGFASWWLLEHKLEVE